MIRRNESRTRDLGSVVLFVPCYIGIVALSFSAAWLVAEEGVTVAPAPATVDTVDVPSDVGRQPLVVQLVMNNDDQQVEPVTTADNTRTDATRDGANEDEPKRNALVMSEKAENGVLVVRHGPTTKPPRVRRAPADVPASSPEATRETRLVCGINSPWPCDPLWGIRGPAEGFHKSEPWAYHRLSMKYHPTDFTYHPKTDWTYHPKRSFKYNPKTDWTYQPRQGVDRRPPDDKW